MSGTKLMTAAVLLTLLLSWSTHQANAQVPSVTATIFVSGSRVIGESVTLTCNATVTGLSSLANDTTIEFSGPSGVTTGTGTSLQLPLNPAVISDAGQYTCVATVTSTLLDSDVNDTVTEDLRLQISSPSVSVTRNGGTPLFVGIVLTLTCEITVTGVPTAMLSNVDVSATWLGAGGNPLMSSDRISITGAMQNSGTNTYISTVEINTLITGNTGTYACQASVIPSGSLMSILDESNGVAAEITLAIKRHLTVSITVDRTDPPGFTPEDSTEYRAASGPQVITCRTTGGAGGGPTYQWSSTCRDCPFQEDNLLSTEMSITRAAVRSTDTGTHTCTATRGEETVMSNIVFNIVGAGIHIPTSSSPTGSQSNNGLVRSRDTETGRRWRFICRSDSMAAGVGELIGLNGTAITTNNFFDISTQQPGELDVNSRADLQDPLTASEQGVYTCRIPLESGEMREINIGIYPNTFSSRPTITSPLVFTPGPSSITLTCTSTTSVATTVTFMRGQSTTIGPLRDGESFAINDVTYQLTQTVTDRRQSTYENVLTITERWSSLAGSTFTCQVENVLGMSETSQSFAIPDVLTVGITVSYTPPPGFTPGPNEYRAASGPVVVICTATGGVGSGNYQYVWTSTCSSGCDFQMTSTGTTSVINRTFVHSGDNGTHACTASRGRTTVTDSIVFNIVGAGIYVLNGTSTGPQPNNGLVVSDDVKSGHRIRFFCHSDSLTPNDGNLTGLDDNTFSDNDFLIIEPPANGGEVRVGNLVGSQQPLPASEQGIFTCQIPLQSGEVMMVNIGVYPIGFNSRPIIVDPLLFTPESPSTVTCISTGSPATTVTFTRGSITVGPLRDEEIVNIDGITYKLVQTVTNRRGSTYENILTISDELSNLVYNTFTCTVANTLGMDTSQLITVSGAEISSSPQTVTVGDTVTYTCTSMLGTAMIEWSNVGSGDMVLEMDSGVTELTLVVDRISQSMNDRMYRCRVIMGNSTISNTVALTIEDPDTAAIVDSDAAAIVGGVLGVFIALVLAYGVVATIVIVVMMHHIRRGRVSINQPGTEQPGEWSAMTKLGDHDIKTSECVAYSQAQLPSTDRAQDAIYEVIGVENQ